MYVISHCHDQIKDHCVLISTCQVDPLVFFFHSFLLQQFSHSCFQLLNIHQLSRRCNIYKDNSVSSIIIQSLGIPCFLGGMSRGLLGRNSPIHIRQRRRDALKEADVVILAGMCVSTLDIFISLRSISLACLFNFWKPTCFRLRGRLQIKLR